MAKIDIISDPICPWCFIGKTRLDRALEANPTHNFIIEWHPYQLNPTMPKKVWTEENTWKQSLVDRKKQ